MFVSLKMATKLNVNIRKLLNNCEDLAKDELNYWRLRKYIKSLDTMIAELVDLEDTQSYTKIPDYVKRLEALKKTTNYIENTAATSVIKKFTTQDSGDESLKEVHQLQKNRHYAQLRKELLQDDNLRRRHVDEAAKSTENMNEAVKYYSEAQEKITEHMLSLTRNLREQTETANRIIRQDTEIVSRSTTVADKNINSLSNETQKLEQHSRNAYKCWMWLMAIFVIGVFVAMILFMKVMKKKKL